MHKNGGGKVLITKRYDFKEDIGGGRAGKLYAIWLLPCLEQRDILRCVIRALAARYGILPFEPHATLCSGRWIGEDASLIAEVNRLKAVLPVTLRAEQIDWTDDWSTYFFLRLKEEGEVFDQAVASVSGAHSPAVGPHLSLLYGMGGPLVDRPMLRREVAEKLPEEIRFDFLVLVTPDSGRWEDVDRWTVVSSSALD